MRWPFLRRLSLRIKLIIPTQQKLLHPRATSGSFLWESKPCFTEQLRELRIAWPVSHAQRQ